MNQPNLKLSGKVALITGASSGIGAATARALAEVGAAVVLAARRRERLDTLAAEITAQGGRAAVVAADLAEPAQARDAVTQAVSAFGQLDILVNNAGLMLLGPVADADATDWHRMLDLNVLALMHATQAAIGVMKPQGSGHIVNISSVSGRGSGPTSAGYSATKWAVGGFSEGLRQEVRLHGIRVTVVEPGVVATELTDHITHTATKDAYEGRIAQMTPLEAEDVAAAVVYAVTQPQRVNVNEILMRPLDQG
ncbi:NADP-dependent 3-hydroxy acid dehydrogenase YdfG [Deinococcus metalli]|uniref:NADP-dependent 3-hydroxy acid dehydrogenase YdfG n=1 Tax=Deinococcus metalli TaxID=1141878 RepID=A0A7W8KFJ7_9DEIO|nr:SDR family NAD(P)-dependent oxidoreductase [Deinococcus metalli]MBB5375614.1 NADP-dependent 3-hydroxy acid dehydrogenase YdfG [Deinococcus metalli]GHF38369.1 oxidoreductase [Deinococcus metalli]